MKGLNVIIAAFILVFGTLHVPRSQPGQNFGGNRSSSRNAASRKEHRLVLAGAA